MLEHHQRAKAAWGDTSDPMSGHGRQRGRVIVERFMGGLPGGALLALLLTLMPHQQRVPQPEPSRAQAEAPAVGFDPPAFDYGTVVQATNVSHTFQLVNRTTNQLRLVALKASCDCTVVSTSLLGQVLAPNESVPVPVSFQTGPRVGPIVSTIDVVLQGERVRYLAQAWLSGTVWPDYSFEPKAADFGEVRPGETCNRVVVFRPEALKDFALIPKQASEGPFQIVVRPTTVSITFRAPPAEHRETHTRTLEVRTSSKRVPSVTIPVSARVVPEVDVSPRLIVLAPSLLSQTSRFTLESERPARIRAVLLDGGEVMPPRDRVLPATWGRTHTVELKNARLVDAQQITFLLDNGGQGVLQCPGQTQQACESTNQFYQVLSDFPQSEGDNSASNCLQQEESGEYTYYEMWAAHTYVTSPAANCYRTVECLWKNNECIVKPESEGPWYSLPKKTTNPCDECQ